ncbi:DUF2252 domain-containing protein [Salipiger bermudensis]|uniref:DUF2252 domain-containing protein n=1 Tax=Salipiger bermudensis TaxID=344736 RepID=UPI001CD6A684|nr:DUF2252 family protein [Salipiger bermudensis]MCA0962008.1 DUF2252 domain-containing protein [Salipiger bermudensis]
MSKTSKTSKPNSKRNSGKRAAASAEAKQAIAPVRDLESRVEAYRELCRAYLKYPCVMRPSALTGFERRLHVRDTIVEDHAVRIDEKAEGAKEKFEALAASLYSFFRGTSLLFHRDMLGEDERMPTVLALGDVHPENFGIMPNADNVPIFGVNDFDDVLYAPFTWDLKRGATGFLIASEEIGGHGKKLRKKITRKFLEGYREGIGFYARHDKEASQQMRADNSPKVVRRMFKKAAKSRKAWLWGRYLNETGRGFPANEELTPISSRIKEFQGYVNEVAKQNGISPEGRAGELRVKDVCLRHGQGTASLGLARYYCLIEGPSKDATDDLIVEFKRARRSALEGLVPENDFFAGGEGDRIAHGQSVHLSNGDVFYGNVEIDGMSFMSRERAPFRDDIDLDELSKKSWKHYAHACGLALAQAHARSDDAGELDYRIEPRILEAMEPDELFIDDILCFARAAVKRIKSDHRSYKRDLKLGAFDMSQKRYR